MKTTLLVVLLFSSCFASSLFKAVAENQEKRAPNAEVTCQAAYTVQCVDNGCSVGCPACQNAFNNCTNSITDFSQLCGCFSTLVNCFAASKDATCDSSVIHDLCLAQLTNCTCGTPYTGSLTYDSCNSNDYCTDAGMCSPLKAVGQMCNSSSDCGDTNADPAWTFDYSCTNGACKQISNYLPGDPCSKNADCELYTNYALGCVSGICASQVIGQTCPQSATNGYVCGAGLYCDEDETCRATLAMGATCDGNNTNIAGDVCGMMAFCDATSNTCVKYISKSAGQACSDSSECNAGLYCSNKTKTCAANLPHVACTSDSDCKTKNSDYYGCDCYSGNPVCIVDSETMAASQCGDTAFAFLQCMEDNKCVTDSFPGGCVQKNCASAHDCYYQCAYNAVKPFNAFAEPSCLVNHVNACTTPSFGMKVAVAWTLVVSAVAALLL